LIFDSLRLGAGSDLTPRLARCGLTDSGRLVARERPDDRVALARLDVDVDGIARVQRQQQSRNVSGLPSDVSFSFTMHRPP